MKHPACHKPGLLMGIHMARRGLSGKSCATCQMKLNYDLYITEMFGFQSEF